MARPLAEEPAVCQHYRPSELYPGRLQPWRWRVPWWQRWALWWARGYLAQYGRTLVEYRYWRGQTYVTRIWVRADVEDIRELWQPPKED